MKATIISLAAITFITGSLLTGCGAAVKKDVKFAEGNMKETHENLNLAQKDSKKEIKATEKTDWQEFKTDSEISIQNRNRQITELRSEISKMNGDRQQELSSKLERLKRKKDDLKKRLVQRNKQLKTNMAQLDESSRVVQIEFEKAFVRDMNELTASLKDLFEKKVE